MGSPQHPDTLIAALRDDTRHGAAEIVGRAATALEAVVRQSAARDGRRLRVEIAAASRRMLATQPAMAPLVALAACVVEAIALDAPRSDARAQALDGILAFSARSARAAASIASRAQALIPPGGRALSISGSSTVRQALLEAGRRRPIEVICLEARPNFEGRDLAATLARAGVRVRVAVDAALAAVVPECDVVLIGADSIGDRGIVNKIGTRAAALCAHAAAIPLYALADSTKVLPPGFPQPIDDDRPPREVWKDAPAGVRLWNRYFEAVPLRQCTGIVSEAGLCNPEDLEARRARMVLPPELR